MPARYLVAISPDESVRARISRRVKQLTAMHLVFERGPMLLFSTGPRQALAGNGMLLGSLWARGAGNPIAERQAQEEVVRSGGQYLIDNGWGPYVALFVTPGAEEVTIVRAPLGNLPCFWWRSEDLVLAGSDISSLIAGGMPRPAIDARALARHIAAEDLRRAETCFDGVHELQGGDCLIIGESKVERHALWSPWHFTRAGSEIADLSKAAEGLRDIIVSAVAAQASSFGSVLLKLSGGLDSSIVAACLAQSNNNVTCLNLVTEHPAGDERRYARAVAQHLRMPLSERLRRIADVQLERSAAARLPRPTARSFTQASSALARELAAETKAEAVFDGGGGDNIFCSLQSARPVADCIRRPSGRPFLWSTARSIARLAEVNLWTVMRRALAVAGRRSWPYRWHVDTRFMSEDSIREVDTRLPHPWLDPPATVLPGKAAHVALVTAAQSVAEGFDPQNELPEFSPLISQPIVECCLRIPTWLWFGEGQNRFAARRAFIHDLPGSILERRSKGAPDCFVADLYEANRGTIRDMLLGGILARENLLDRHSIEARLDDEAPVQGHDFLRIMHLVDAEAWARSWS